MGAVSVCGDATYVISGYLCSGSTKHAPAGTACPMKGDIAASDCYKNLVSYDEYQSKCVAPETAECKILRSGAWGCVFPNVPCSNVMY